MTFLSTAAQAAIASVFAVACFGKVRSRAAFIAFTGTLTGLGRLGRRRSGSLALLVVGVETAIVILAVLPSGARAELGLAVVTLVAFSTTTGYAAARGTVVRCRCFGADDVVGRSTFVRNAVLTLVAIGGLWAGWSGSDPRPSVTAVAAVTGVTVGLVLSRWSDLWYLFAPR